LEEALKNSERLSDVLAEAFLTECPATPLSHLTDGTKGLAVEGVPYQVSAYVTRACNLRCLHCYISAGRPLPDELSYEEWSHALSELADLGTKVLYILGGEPMLRRDIYDIISSASGLGMKVSMSTNGTLIGKREAVRLRESGLSEVQVSLDGPSEAINDSIRPPGSFRAAISAIRYLKEAGLRVTIGVTLFSANEAYVKSMIDLARDLGVDDITFEALAPFGRAIVNGLQRPSGNIWRTILTLAAGSPRISLSSMRFLMPTDLLQESYRKAKELLGKGSYQTCPAGRSRMVIDANGDVYGCELLIGLMKPEGNVRRDSIKELWRSGFRDLRQRDVSNVLPCSSCTMYELCRGGCPARALQRYRTLRAPDPLCPYVKGLPAPPASRL
jgi:radical SAM protein with 4Fe4S-binding SPASM domain